MLTKSQKTLLKLVGKRITVFHSERLPLDTPFIMVGNHQSYLDPLTMWYATAKYCRRQMYFPAKHELRKYFGRLGNWLGMLYIDTKDKAAVLKTANENLDQGYCIGIFPESTRNRVSKINMLKGKTGAARLALATGVPVIPTGIFVPKGATMPQAVKNYFLSHDQFSITIGQPINFPKQSLESLNYDQLVDTTRTIMKSIGKLCNKNYTY
ncbi:lysophospholipid acyltransferase family protein [Patescibacteria group bacterium]